MNKCRNCGREFDVTTARRRLGASYGAGIYNDYYPEADICDSCAIETVSADWEAGAEIIDLMGDSWDWD